MTKKLFAIVAVLIICLPATITYLIIENSIVNRAYDALHDEYMKTLFDQTLVMPKGLDEHYERIRRHKSQEFTNKGDSGWLLFYATEVLHDLGNYSYGQRCAEFNSTAGILCKNLTAELATNFQDYINRSLTDIGLPNSNMNRMQTIYELTNNFVTYLNDTNGFARFPVETLTG